MKTFIMLELPESAIDYLQVLQAGFDFDSVPRHKLHLTVKFVGDTPSHVDGAIRAGIKTMVLPELRLYLDRIGVFYNQTNVVWAGMSGDVDKLAAFAANVERVCGLRSTIFRPHITLGRTSKWVAGVPVANVSHVFCPTALIYAESAKANGETIYRTLERIDY